MCGISGLSRGVLGLSRFRDFAGEAVFEAVGFLSLVKILLS